MDKVELSRTELEFLRRLLLDAQREVAAGGRDADALVAGLELALALLRWDGAAPPDPELQLGLGAAVEAKLGLDAMCAHRQWRNELRRSGTLSPP